MQRGHHVGKALWKSVEAVEARGASEVVIHLKESSGVFLSALTSLFIYPKEIIDATGDGPLKQFIGTGPPSSPNSSLRRSASRSTFKSSTLRRSCSAATSRSSSMCSQPA